MNPPIGMFLIIPLMLVSIYYTIALRDARKNGRAIIWTRDLFIYVGSIAAAVLLGQVMLRYPSLGLSQ